VSLSPEQFESLIEARAEEFGLELPEGSAKSLARHLSLVEKWNPTLHLTSVRDPREAVERHVLESMAAAQEIDPAAGRLLDIGSGNGYPAVPFKILHPSLRLTMLEPALRKSVFLKEVAGALSLGEVDVVRGRVDAAEDLAPFAPLGAISMRAVAAVPAVCEGAASALAPGGKLLLFLGPAQEAEALANLPAGLVHAGRRALPGRKSAHLTVLVRTLV